MELSSKSEGGIERTDALMQATIRRLSRSYPEQAISGAALEALQQMSPHLQEAMAALSRIEERRKLTDKELSYRRAFNLLLEATR
jgi:hypothetical protein